MTPVLLIPTLCLAVLGTSFISGILGMAGGMILMGILLGLLPVGTAMMLHGTTQFASNGWRALLWRGSVNGRVVAGYALGAFVALALFAALQVVLPRAWVLIALGSTPFLVSALPARLKLNVDLRGHATACGLICMALQLVCGISGPLLDSFFIASRMDRRAVVATKAASQTLSHAIKVAYFGAVLPGADAAPGLGLVVALIVCAMAGTSASRRVLERMSDAGFRAWTRRTLWVVGSFYLASGLWELAR